MKLLHNKLIIIVGLVVLLGGLVAFYFWNQTFRISSVSPNPAPYVVTQIEFTFSHPLDQSYDLKKAKISNDAVKGTFKLTASSIVFKPADAMPKGRLTFTFPGIRSTSGEQLDATSTVNVKYVPYNQLSKDEQKRQIDQSDSFQNDFPITSYVPHAAPTWKVEFILPSESGLDKLTLVVTPYIERGTREPEVDYNARLEDVHKEFEAYVTTSGFKLSDYYIQYVNNYLSRYDQTSPNGAVGD
jgi:hypothetical protein